MKKLRFSVVLCVTICSVLVLALAGGVVSYASNTGVQQLSWGPEPAPDDNLGNFQVAWGPEPAPDDNLGNIRVAWGPEPAPDDNLGNVRAA
jgi:hypothetical protein